MSATEQMRAMLDDLMGTARDGSDSQRQHLQFTDQKVCRAFLLNCCPHDIFASTKLELGSCSKVHDPALRADYLKANQTHDYMYEESALEKVQNFVSDADKKSEYLKRKLAETQEKLTAEEASKMDRLHELTEILGKKLAQVDKAEADGDLEAKQSLITEAELIKKERSLAEAEYRRVSRPASSHQQQNLRVCDICSAYLGIHDNDSRLADHFGGKLHLSFITVREKLEDLKKLVAEKRATKSSSNNQQNDRQSNRERQRDYYHADNNSRDYDRHSRSREQERYRERDYDADRYRNRYRERPKEPRYREPERERSRSNGRYYGRETRDARESRDSRSSRDMGPRDRFRDERELTYQRRLREWEKREVEKSRKYAIRLSEERDRKQLEEQESKKLKEFLEDYKDDRDDIRFYRGSALSRRLADRRKELEQDELIRQKEKLELELLSKSCAMENNSSPSLIQNVTNTTDLEHGTSTTNNGHSSLNGANSSINNINHLSNNHETHGATPMRSNDISNPGSAKPASKGQSTEDKRKQVEELIGRIPTDKDHLFARDMDWSLLDENLMEKRIRPWVTKKIAEYMGEKEVELIDFICTMLNNHADGNSVLREVALVIDDEAEKFVVHLWRLLIFELEAKKIGLRK